MVPGGDYLKLSDLNNYYLSYNLFQFSLGLIGVFLNLFFFSKGGYGSVFYFQILSNVFLITFFILTGYLMKRYHPKKLYLLGEVSLIALLMAVLFIGGVLTNVIIFGILYGVTEGIYWASSNLLTLKVPKRAQRVSFVAINNLIGGVVALFAPAIGGLLIQYSTFTGAFKFLNDFLLASVILLLSGYFVMKLRQKVKEQSAFKLGNIGIEDRQYQKFKLYFSLSQIFLLPFAVIMPIYVFEATNSYAIAGIYASYLLFFTILSNFIFRKSFNENGIFPKVGVAAIILSSFLLVLPILPIPLNAFVFGGIVTLFSTPLENFALVKFMNLVEKRKATTSQLFWTNREWYLVTGRVLVFVGLLMIPGTFLTSSLSLILVFPILSFYSLYYLRLMKKN